MMANQSQDLKGIIKEENIHPSLLSYLLYSKTVLDFSKEACGDIVLHDGPETPQDRMIQERNDNLWKHKYLPMYHERCRKASIPKEYWRE